MKKGAAALKSTVTSWLKFNLVGIIGLGVQLTALALFNRLLRGHYLLATIAALELTLLHNFIWHVHYTWRNLHGSILTRLLRFHLSNGLVSLAGNLALMRLLVAHAHLPLLAANSIAITCCSLANFFLSHCWIFASAKNFASAAPSSFCPDVPAPHATRHHAVSSMAHREIPHVAAGFSSRRSQPQTPP
jgi:putative flippase GtrA